MLQVFTLNILPIAVVAGLGVALRQVWHVDKQAVSRLAFYALSPCLVFTALVSSPLRGEEVAGMALFTGGVALAMIGLGVGLGRALRLARREQAALLLVITFTNAGNYGLTLNQLRYGSDGLSRAIVYFTSSTVLLYTLGIFVASLGRLSWRHSLNRLVRLPAFYAVLLALAVLSLDLTVPAPLMKGIEIASNGAIPVMIVVLGMQIADLRRVSSLRLALPAVGLKMLVSPLAALVVARFLGLTGLSYNVSLLQASMPTAVVTTILATEFDVVPEAVTTVVVLSTLASPVTVSLLVSLFGL